MSIVAAFSIDCPGERCDEQAIAHVDEMGRIKCDCPRCHSVWWLEKLSDAPFWKLQPMVPERKSLGEGGGRIVGGTRVS